PFVILITPGLKHRRRIKRCRARRVRHQITRIVWLGVLLMETACNVVNVEADHPNLDVSVFEKFAIHPAYKKLRILDNGPCCFPHDPIKPGPYYERTSLPEC